MNERELTSVGRIRGIYLTLVKNQLENIGLNDITEANRRFGEMLRRVRAEAWSEGVREAFESECYTVTDDWSIFKSNPYQGDA